MAEVIVSSIHLYGALELLLVPGERSSVYGTSGRRTSWYWWWQFRSSEDNHQGTFSLAPFCVGLDRTRDSPGK